MEPQYSKFVFRGKADEWFGIWSVNLLLSILTLGIYSAWAKVRRNKYFYNNTFVGGRNFDYHATGMQLLIGRILAVCLFLSITITAYFSLAAAAVVTLAFSLFYPWLMFKSLQFNARMSSFSNVRFQFTGSLADAYWVYFIHTIHIVLTLGISYPVFERARYTYIANGHKLGTSAFNMTAPISDFYGILFKSIPWLFLALAIGWVFAFALEVLMDLAGFGWESVLATSFFMGTILAAWVFFFIYSSLLRNMVFGITRIEGGHRLDSNLHPLVIVWIGLTNLLLAVASLGLLLPWGHVRMARYLANHSGVWVAGSLDDFVGTQQADPTALGEGYADLDGGMDIGISI